MNNEHPKFSKDELDLIKSVFKGQPVLLKVIRKVFFQVELTESEKKIKETFKSEDLYTVLRKHFIPFLTDDWAIGHEYDCWTGMGLEQRLCENAVQMIQARGQTIQYLTEQLGVLFGKNEAVLKFVDLSNIQDKPAVEVFVNFISRSEIHARVQNSLRDLHALAEGGLSTEEQMKQLQKNSKR